MLLNPAVLLFSLLSLLIVSEARRAQYEFRAFDNAVTVAGDSIPFELSVADSDLLAVEEIAAAAPKKPITVTLIKKRSMWFDSEVAKMELPLGQLSGSFNVPADAKKGTYILKAQMKKWYGGKSTLARSDKIQILPSGSFVSQRWGSKYRRFSEVQLVQGGAEVKVLLSGKVSVKVLQRMSLRVLSVQSGLEMQTVHDLSSYLQKDDGDLSLLVPLDEKVNAAVFVELLTSNDKRAVFRSQSFKPAAVELTSSSLSASKCSACQSCNECADRRCFNCNSIEQCTACRQESCPSCSECKTCLASAKPLSTANNAAVCQFCDSELCKDGSCQDVCSSCDGKKSQCDCQALTGICAQCNSAECQDGACQSECSACQSKMAECNCSAAKKIAFGSASYAAVVAGAGAAATSERCLICESDACKDGQCAQFCKGCEQSVSQCSCDGKSDACQKCDSAECAGKNSGICQKSCMQCDQDWESCDCAASQTAVKSTPLDTCADCGQSAACQKCDSAECVGKDSGICQKSCMQCDQDWESCDCAASETAVKPAFDACANCGSGECTDSACIKACAGCQKNFGECSCQEAEESLACVLCGDAECAKNPLVCAKVCKSCNESKKNLCDCSSEVIGEDSEFVDLEMGGDARSDEIETDDDMPALLEDDICTACGSIDCQDAECQALCAGCSVKKTACSCATTPACLKCNSQQCSSLTSGLFCDKVCQQCEKDLDTCECAADEEMPALLEEDSEDVCDICKSAECKDGQCGDMCTGCSLKKAECECQPGVCKMCQQPGCTGLCAKACETCKSINCACGEVDTPFGSYETDSSPFGSYESVSTPKKRTGKKRKGHRRRDSMSGSKF